MSQIWKDEAGFVVTADLVLISSILVLGLMVGLISLRDQIVTELGDVGYAFALMNQSYTWSGVTGHTALVEGSAMFDATDFCDADPPIPDAFPALRISVQESAEDGEDDAG